jgi:hypothetical protein
VAGGLGARFSASFSSLRPFPGAVVEYCTAACSQVALFVAVAVDLWLDCG